MHSPLGTRRGKVDQGQNGENEVRQHAKVHRSRVQYTVGWVCALSKEQTAAIAMLDEDHPELPTRAGDDNAYTLGSVAGHIVVIACLPEGQIGTVPAAQVATSMNTTFPNLKFLFMVGIGGAVPLDPDVDDSPDVRLVDIVVGTPTGQFPGVVQWDFGKAETEGFRRTGTMNKPPKFLLTRLNKLKSRHEMYGTKIPNYVDEMVIKRPCLVPTYGRSADLQDIVFQADYIHENKRPQGAAGSASQGQGKGDGNRNSGSCRYFDPAYSIERYARDLTVHYGLIASGNEVIKNTVVRDQINKDLGGNVHCFEMEAAGLMDLPFLVNRGICDYCDSHKHKAWQGYAAAVAAAFAKELLSHVPPVEVNQLQPVWEQLPRELRGKLQHKDVRQLRAAAHSEEHEIVLNWLTPTEYGTLQSDFLRQRQDRTGNWFLESPKFSRWRDAQGLTLFGPGIPGSGKTILTSLVIDEISSYFSGDSTIGIAYVYCNFNKTASQKLEDLLASFAKQLGMECPGLPRCLQSLYDRHHRYNQHGKRTRPSAAELFDALCKVSGLLSKIYLFVDALDECHETERSKLLPRLRELQARLPHKVNIFVTSRRLPDIESAMTNCLELDVKDIDDDIRHFTRNSLPEVLRHISSHADLEDRIADEITTSADGMFLLAHLYLNLLRYMTSPKEIRLALEDFKQHDEPLVHAYKEVISRIREQLKNHRDLGWRILAWISFADRPLTVTELQYALSMRPGDTTVDPEAFQTVDLMISVCAGLVVVDKGSNIIRLARYTTQNYLKDTREISSPKPKSKCLVYAKHTLCLSPVCRKT